MLCILATTTDVDEQVVKAQKLVQRGAIAIPFCSQDWWWLRSCREESMAQRRHEIGRSGLGQQVVDAEILCRWSMEESLEGDLGAGCALVRELVPFSLVPCDGVLVHASIIAVRLFASVPNDDLYPLHRGSIRYGEGEVVEGAVDVA